MENSSPCLSFPFGHDHLPLFLSATSCSLNASAPADFPQLDFTQGLPLFLSTTSCSLNASAPADFPQLDFTQGLPSQQRSV